MLIEPKILKGFRDFLPLEAAARKDIQHTLEKIFESFGFQPIDTPVLEYTEVLLGKGGGETDKQMYRFRDQGNRDVAMRFDLTVPFARFMARNENDLIIPFKRYHIDKVWRENTQRGRYREFTQCDFDIVGTDSFSADFEILLMMYRSFEALGISDITIKLNHRGIFNRFLELEGIQEKSTEIMRSIDKLSKLGPAKVRELLEAEIGLQAAEKILTYIQPKDNFLDTLAMITELSGGENDESLRMKNLYEGFQRLGIQDRFFLDSSIMRGLDYYTGIVYETFFDKLPEIGSVCSGGRYNDLASLYTKTHLPGVGSSIGLDRLMAALEELGRAGSSAGSADIGVFCLDEKLSAYYHSLAEQFRREGLKCDVFYEQQKLGRQFKTAEKKGIPIALICGEDEQANSTVSMKDLTTREAYNQINLQEAISTAREIVERINS
ncbi:MAG: histidine--tRNA ligase [Spirochaetia bacterium]|nr:histidine--tRNA ligase [Spirochaetia bacterium]